MMALQEQPYKPHALYPLPEGSGFTAHLDKARVDMPVKGAIRSIPDPD